MRALAEAPQLLLEYSGLEYEYLMSWDHFDDVWSKCEAYNSISTTSHDGSRGRNSDLSEYCHFAIY